MAHSKADLQSILATQQQTLQQFAQLQEQFAETLQRLSLSQASTEKMVRSHPTLDTLAASISEFDYGTLEAFSLSAIAHQTNSLLVSPRRLAGSVEHGTTLASALISRMSVPDVETWGTKKVSVHLLKPYPLLREKRHISVNIEKKAVTFQIDTGSDRTIISVQTWKQLGSPPLSDTSSVRATTYNGDTIPLRGSFRCAYSFGTHSVSGTCYVSDISSNNLLGAEWIFKLGLYDQPLNNLQSDLQPEDERALICSPEIHALSASNAREYVYRRYPEICSDSLGHCKFAKASLRLRPDAQPVFRPKRPVPYAVVPLVEAELDRLEKLGVISKVNYSAWAAPLVAVRKRDGRLRLCADFSTGLNDALEMHQYPLPTPEDIFSTLNGGTVFSQIDFSDAYLQIEVSEESRELLTLNTHCGLYRYNRLPFGVKSAPGIFQQIMDTLIAGLHGVVAYLDDVTVVGKTEEAHNGIWTPFSKELRNWDFTFG
ncbi:Gag Pol polyprotein [Trichuris trichiura]|uniref:Gag Pol polyprotein n=1 Tax=Trichuris trichiura TaxID=36087 RepID=A0A077ZJF6_TRITR|nr:Gag Pol polyprotein [Trichuris trichiura]